MIIVNRKITAFIISFMMLAVCFVPADSFASTRNVISQKKVSFSVKIVSYNSVKLTWKKSAGKGAEYQIYRARSGKKLVRIARVKGGLGYFTDKKLRTDKTYKYKIVSVRTETEEVPDDEAEIESDENGIMAASSESDTDTVTVKTIAYSKIKKITPKIAKPRKFRAARCGSSTSIRLRWKGSKDAVSYKIYRSSKKTRGYDLIAKVSSKVRTFKDRAKKSKPFYYYKIKAVRKINGKEHSSSKVRTKVYVKYKISGSSDYTASRLAAYFKSKGKSYPSYYRRHTNADTIKEFAKIYVQECRAENIKPEVAFAQCMLETGWLTFRGDVSISQYNFAGLGATGGGVPGNSFRTIRIGIRAHIQHLKAYASKAALNKKCVDPRFSYVTRGTCRYVEWLGIQENPYGGGWAATYGYGGDIIKLISEI